MRTRLMGYEDYGINNEHDIICHARNGTFREKLELFQICGDVYDTIASDLYNSIIFGWSYSRIELDHPIPLPKVDFYGYRRKCIYLYAQKMGKA